MPQSYDYSGAASATVALQMIILLGLVSYDDRPVVGHTPRMLLLLHSLGVRRLVPRGNAMAAPVPDQVHKPRRDTEDGQRYRKMVHRLFLC